MNRSSLRLPSKINLDIPAAIFVTLLPLGYFNSALRGALVLASEDGVLFNVPLRVAAANIIRAGSLPLWNPYIFSGMPLHAAAQGGVLFPLNWFFLFFDPPTATNLMALSTYMAAGLGAYLYARRSGSSVAGAVLTSIAWQWSGFFIGQISHVNIVQTAALLPWLLWAIDGFGKRASRTWGLIVAATVMLQAFTGHQQTLVYSLLLATAYALVMWRVHERTSYLWSLMLLGAGMLLAAVQMLPTYELMCNSLRSASSFEFFTSFSLPPKFFLTFFAPYLFGGGDGLLFRVRYFGPPFYGEFIGYVGVGTVMLAAIAVVLSRKDPTTRFWTAVAVIAFALALGAYWPLKSYRIVYFMPVLNLFRVPARHMMEVDLALAVLAGRGLTALTAEPRRKAAMRIALAVALPVFVLTCLAVTVARSASFQLARPAPVTLLRAPELFMPILVVVATTLVLWRYAYKRNAIRLFLLIAVIAVDLCIWGQLSGWRGSSVSPRDVYWNGPPTVKHLPQSHSAPYRIITTPHPFDPLREAVGPMTTHSTDWVAWLNPDLYMMSGIENAAGYDGFGLGRYSRLARNMTVWGELSHPDASLRGQGRELDLLNVKYLLAMSDHVASADPTNASSSTNHSAVTQVYGGQRFAESNLGLPDLKKGHRVTFSLEGVEAERIALMTSLSWGTQVPTGTKVGKLRVSTSDGRTFDFDLLAGRDTAEWAYDRSDIKAAVQHRRAPIGTTYTVEDARERYEGHAYVSSFSLPERGSVTSVEVEANGASMSPELLLSVMRASLINSATDKVVPLRREWLTDRQVQTADRSSGRWLKRVDADGVAIYENQHVLPRVWLTTTARVFEEQQLLEVIHNGKFPNGEVWDPLHTALVESSVPIPDSAISVSHRAEITRNDSNRVDVSTSSASPTVLVLSANHYPGWRAYVDGQLVETLRVNYNLRGVTLPTGNHEVSFVYFPKSVLIGVLISLFAASGLTFWYFRLWGQVRRLFLHRREERI